MSDDAGRRGDMSTRLAKLAADGRLTIDSVGPGRFHLAGQRVDGGILLTPTGWQAWPIDRLDGIEPTSLIAALNGLGGADVLLIGCGARLDASPAGLVAALRKAGQIADVMATAPASRSYNLMLSEGRRVAAALMALPVDGASAAPDKKKAGPEGPA